ncbi:DNA alkylation repair protein [Bacteroides sp. UBA939]|uniref:DNA alkylation repair protein n=1 Tax=Bacteroides sp. UBA939 TaxID=1946092 RepID=UPI0025BB817A|nr:DNA alkylation repair protein [Bacteroides sp. UBA939]
MKHQILTEIRQTLKDNVDAKTQTSGDRYFKEEVKLYGVKVPLVGQIGKLAFEKVRNYSKQEIFELCEELWKSGYTEEGFIACNWSYYLHKQYEPADFIVFERWVHNYVTNWATCDTLCNHTIGTFVEMYPDYVSELKKWAHSDNRWVKRAAAVTLIVPARKGLFFDDILEIANTLLMDGDDLVQKGYGWMLKAASLSERTAVSKKLNPETKREHLEAVFNFVMKHKAVMPRTALRYAIEKMSPEMRAEAMKK